jgi:NAD(P)-dependent dehydrogenase (short-subunit alcohol dehydrogenase family)
MTDSPELSVSPLARNCFGAEAVVDVSSLAAAGYRENAATTRGLVATVSVPEGLAWCDAHPDALADGGYRVSKAATVLHMLATAATVAARGIRVNCTCRGVTRSRSSRTPAPGSARTSWTGCPNRWGGSRSPPSRRPCSSSWAARPRGTSPEVICVDGGNVSGRHARDLGVDA